MDGGVGSIRGGKDFGARKSDLEGAKFQCKDFCPVKYMKYILVNGHRGEQNFSAHASRGATF